MEKLEIILPVSIFTVLLIVTFILVVYFSIYKKDNTYRTEDCSCDETNKGIPKNIKTIISKIEGSETCKCVECNKYDKTIDGCICDSKQCSDYCNACNNSKNKRGIS